MATIRVRDWTKEQIEEIRERESHSSHDSVIKSLLKDRQLAQFAGTETASQTDEEPDETPEPIDKPFDDLTVFEELSHAENGVLFLWCPKCGNEMAHLTVENPIDISLYEMECQRCLTQLDQHALVAIEIGYPIEQRLVDETLQNDLKECVIDYWDRTLAQLANGELDDDTDLDQLVWEFDDYVKEFGWEWPTDVPVVSFQAGETYRNTATGESIAVLEPVTEQRHSINSYRVKKYDPAVTDSDDVEPEILDDSTIVNAILGRNLEVEDASSP